jgi:phenylacetate-CoA ligase
MPRERIEKVQSERLSALVKRVTRDVPFYRKRFEECGISPDEIRTPGDLARIPFTTKDDLRQNFPYEMVAVPMRKVVRIHASSGTTGLPTVVAYKRKDLDTWTDLVARIIVAGGTTADDIVHIAFTYGLFTGGFGLHYGAEKVGAAVIPVSSGNTERQIIIMHDFGSTVLVSTPTYALRIAEVMADMGIPREEFPLRYGLFGGEGCSESMRREIEGRLGIIATDNYGLSEVIGPGVSGECLEKAGLHFQEDHFIPEIVDPETGEVLPDGEQGELVITTLTKEAVPLLRYRTRDLCSLNKTACVCGRTMARMSKVKGRTDDMLIIRGVNVFPSQLEEVLLDIEGTEPQYLIVLDRKGAIDDFEVQVEITESLFSDEMKVVREKALEIERRLASALGVRPRVVLVEPRSLERTTGKAKRVLDRRQIGE